MKKMETMVFLSRHTPTEKQSALARARGYDLVHVGDCDAFEGDFRSRIGDAKAIACVHPALALRAFAVGLTVGVFENANRAPEGAPPTFEAAALHIYEPPSQRRLLGWQSSHSGAFVPVSSGCPGDIEGGWEPVYDDSF